MFDTSKAFEMGDVVSTKQAVALSAAAIFALAVIVGGSYAWGRSNEAKAQQQKAKAAAPALTP